MTSELKQTLFKGATTLVSCAFAATGADLAGTLFPLFQGLAVNVASQFGVELCMPYITKKWLSHPEQIVNNHIQRALVPAIHAALADIEKEYFVRDGVSPREAQSLRDFFAVLRDRSELEYVEATRDELEQQEVLNYIYDRTATTKRLQDRLRIKLDPVSDEFYFTDRFIAYFPNRFAELMQFHFKEKLKGKEEDQEKAKKAMDLLFFDTLNAGLLELKTGQQELRQLLDGALQANTQTLQRVEFYGEIWISAIRKNRDQLDRIEEKVDETLQRVGTLGDDVADLKNTVQQLYSQSVQPGLLMSEQFQNLTQARTDAQLASADAQASLAALETTIGQNPALADSLKLPLSQTQSNALAANSRQQQAEQALVEFLQQVAATQQAILNATSHRADQARKLFEQGLFAEANAALDADELRRDQADLLQQRDAVRQQLEQLAQDFLLKAQLTVLTKELNWFAEARHLYQEAISTNETYDTYFALAYFLTEHNQHLDAIIYYEKAARLTGSVTHKASVFNNLALLYSNSARPSEAEAAYDEVLNIYRHLVEQDPATHLSNVANTLNNLGLFYFNTTRPDESETAYDEALSIRRELAQQNPATHLPGIAMTLDNLANLYANTARPDAAEAAYSEALSIRRQLAQQNPATFLPYVATTLNNLANLYTNAARSGAAEAAYSESLSIRRQLAQQNPATHLPDMAMALNNLGLLYADTARLSEAETVYDEALGICRQLAQQNSATYLPYVAMPLNNLAILYRKMTRLNEAEDVSNEVLDIYRHLAQQNPATYLPNVAITLNNLGLLYADTARSSEAEVAYNEALAIRLNLAQKYPDFYANHVAQTAVNMSIMYLQRRPEPERDKSIDFALITISWTLPYVDRVHYARQLAQTAVNISGRWGIDWQVELKKRKDELVKHGFLFIPPSSP